MKFGIPNPRLYITLVLFMGYIFVGQNQGLMGPTLVHMEKLLHTDTQAMAMSFTFENLGGFIGSIVSGVYFDRYNPQFQIVRGFILMGVLTCISPWMPNVYLYCIMMSVRKFIIRYTGNGNKPFLLNLWDGSVYKNAIFQAVDLAWVIGSFTIALLVIPFLSELPKEANRTISQNYEPINPDITLVRYPYVMVGVLSIVVGIFLSCAQKSGTSNNMNIINSNPKSQELLSDGTKLNIIATNQDTESSSKNGIVLKILTCIYAVFIVWQGCTMSTFISVFVIKGLGWSVEKGPLMTSLFRGSQACARFIGIPLSVYLTPTQILSTNMVIGVIAYSVMYAAVAVFHSENLLWISTALAGCAVSNSFPTIVLWGAQYMKVTAAYSSLFGAAASVGVMSSSSLVGYLFQNYTPMSVVYVLLFASTINIFIFILLQITARL